MMFSASPNAFSMGRRSQAHEGNSLLGSAVMTNSGFSEAVACEGGFPQSLTDRLWLCHSCWNPLVAVVGVLVSPQLSCATVHGQPSVHGTQPVSDWEKNLG